jgi:hypothetical protein
MAGKFSGRELKRCRKCVACAARSTVGAIFLMCWLLSFLGGPWIGEESDLNSQ